MRHAAGKYQQRQRLGQFFDARLDVNGQVRQQGREAQITLAYTRNWQASEK